MELLKRVQELRYSFKSGIIMVQELENLDHSYFLEGQLVINTNDHPHRMYMYYDGHFVKIAISTPFSGGIY